LVLVLRNTNLGRDAFFIMVGKWGCTMRFVPLYLVKENSILAESIVNIRNQVLLRKDTILTHKHIDRIRDFGIKSVYIKDPVVEEWLQEEVKDIIEPHVRKNAVFKVQQGVEAFLKAVKSSRSKSAYSQMGEKLHAELNDIAIDLIDEVLNTSQKKISLMDIKSEAYYRQEHAVNTAVLSIMMGTKMGFKDNELKLLALGALMMDIGFNEIHSDAFDHTKPLSPDQWHIVMKHPEMSYTHVKENTTFNAHVKSIILQHHERIDGSGYPLGLNGDKINRMAKIVMAADVYDAMTSDRCYRNAYPHHEVIEYIMGCAGKTFDFNVATILSRSVTPYPVGSYVKLSNNQKGVIIKNDPVYPLRPLVRTFGVSRYTNRESYQIDLMDVHNVTINDLIYDLKHT